VQAVSSKSSSLKVGSAFLVAIRFTRRDQFSLRILIAWSRPSTSILFEVTLINQCAVIESLGFAGGFQDDGRCDSSRVHKEGPDSSAPEVVAGGGGRSRGG
jgi:hypothetical protein